MRRFGLSLCCGLTLSLLLFGGVAVAAADYPLSTGTLTVMVPADGVAAGGSVRVVGSGFVPGSAVQVILRSTPVVLASALADGSGSVDRSVTIPVDVSPGMHSLEMTGASPGGGTRSLSSPLQVNASGVAAVGTARKATDTSSASSTLWLWVVAGAVLAATAALALVLSRRRSSRWGAHQ
jgi:hypothetical protein